MIRVLAVYPSFDPAMNEMASVWSTLAKSGRVHCTVVARRHDVLKGFDSDSTEEHEENLSIRRFGAVRIGEELRAIARAANPDLIFCAVALNLPVARDLARAVRKPIVLHTEYFLDDAYLVRRRFHFGIAVLRHAEAEIYRHRLIRSASMVLSSDPTEFHGGPTEPAGTVRYLPWPYYGKLQPAEYSDRDKAVSAFIGSLSKIKGAVDLAAFWRQALVQLPRFTLNVIGVPVDDAGKRAMDEFRALEKAGGVVVRSRCSREGAEELIKKGLFVFSPGKTFGWGFILDAWRTGTVVVTRSPHFDLVPGENCLLARSAPELVRCIRLLQEDEQLWRRLQAGGFRTLEQHSVENVANLLFASLEDAME